MSKTKEHLGHLRCEECPLNQLRESGKSLELPISDRECDILVVGDSPIMAELVAKETFSGRGSMFFKKTLAAVIKSWNEGQEIPIKPRVHFTYSVLCQQKEEPKSNVIKCCNGRLRSEIAIRKPKVILALGSAAMKALGHTRAGILQERGQRKWDSKLNAYIMATFHPQYVLTNTSVFETWTMDLTKAMYMLLREKGKPYNPPQTKVDVIRHLPQAIKFLRQLRAKKRRVASDIETMGFNFKNHGLLCMGFTFKAGHAVVISKEVINNPKINADLKKTIESENIIWLYHNGKFDNKFFWAQRGIKARTDIDTMLKHYCIDVRKGTHDLEQVAMEYCDAEPWEHHAHKYVKESFDDIPKEILYKYQGIDCDMTFRVDAALEVHFQAERKRGRKIDKLFALLSRSSNAYMRMELAGFKADLNYVEKLAEEYEPLLEKYVEDMIRMAHIAGWDEDAYVKWADTHKLAEWTKKGKKEGKKQPGPTKKPGEFNPNSYMQIRFLLFGVWKLKPIIKKGKVSTDSDSLEIYRDKLKDVEGIKFINIKRAYAKDKKLYGTYVKGIWKHIDMETHRVHSTFKLHGTETGRLSSSDPNVHNIPRDSKIKNIFIAEPDYVILQADYSQAELRVLAVESDDPWLKNVYYIGSDLHDQMSLQLYGDQFTKEQRVRAKAVNFGIPYGRTEYTLAAEHDMSIPEAKKLIRDWFAPQPKTKEFMDARRNEPLRGGFYETPIGRTRPFGLITEKNRNGVMNEAGNFPIQATASDLTVWSVCELVDKLDAYNELKGFEAARLVNTVHDSIISEVYADEQIIAEVREIFRSTMESAGEVLLNTDVPFVSDFEIGHRWGDLFEFDVNDSGKITVKKKVDGKKINVDFKKFMSEKVA